MIIRFTRARLGSQDTLTCVRDDGSTTITRLNQNVGAEHDLVHYVVETTLGRRDSFYGLVARGWQVQDFDVPGAAKALNLPDEAGQTEHIVAALQLDLRDALNGDVASAVKATCAAGRRPSPPPADSDLAPQRVQIMKEQVQSLLRQWQALGPGDSMELEFPSA
jgi:hypothetical protein